MSYIYTKWGKNCAWSINYCDTCNPGHPATSIPADDAAGYECRLWLDSAMNTVTISYKLLVMSWNTVRGKFA